MTSEVNFGIKLGTTKTTHTPDSRILTIRTLYSEREKIIIVLLLTTTEIKIRVSVGN